MAQLRRSRRDEGTARSIRARDRFAVAAPSALPAALENLAAHEHSHSVSLADVLEDLAVQGDRARRKRGRSGEVGSLQGRQAQALKVLDEAIDSLRLIRDWVETTEGENRELKARVTRIEEAFKR